MKNCDKCSKHINDVPYLERVNPTGVKGIFWCPDCIKKFKHNSSFNLTKMMVAMFKGSPKNKYN
jgi:hypothetical protein